MNTIKKVLISLAMSALFINLAVANNYIPVLKVEAGIDKKFYLALENVSAETSVQILDQEGFTLIEESVAASEAFEKVFNLEKLQAGIYTLVIKSNYKETVQPMIITGRNLIVDESKRKEFYPAIIKMEKNNVNLSLLNPTKSKVVLSIQDATGETLYRDALNDLMVVEKRYDLSQLSSGQYTVVVDTSNEVFTQRVQLR